MEFVTFTFAARPTHFDAVTFCGQQVSSRSPRSTSRSKADAVTFKCSEPENDRVAKPWIMHNAAVNGIEAIPDSKEQTQF